MDKDRIRSSIQTLLQLTPDNEEREGLRDTPERFADAWEFWTSGYSQIADDVLKCFDDGAYNYDEMVFQAAIPMYSLCEHHLCPFFGYVHMAYIPNTKIVGLSKMARLVEVYARRLQVQERLTCQIADALMEHLSAKGAGVVIQARHCCLESRGVQKIGTITMTSALRGNFKSAPEVRAEFMSLVTAAMSGIKSI